MFQNILSLYGLDPQKTTVLQFGDGLINHTWKVNTDKENYILQKVNSDVFKSPAAIDQNLTLLRNYLSKENPEYLFISPVIAINGESLLHIENGYYRLFPFVEGSVSLNTLTKKEEAYEAAKQFGKFSKILDGFNVNELNITIPNFHNLALRFDQFKTACNGASAARLEKSQDSIKFINDHQDIVDTYQEILNNSAIPLRVIHHDTKISNILFDDQNKGLCVIDLDTVMPGYFISDVGDMMRTYLSAVSEEETDFSKIHIRKDFYKAIFDGYMGEMNDVLSEAEKPYFIYAGKFIIYMQAIRFLSDYLQNDIYYGAKYEDHNFNRANNQIELLKQYLKIEAELINL
ncbi:aminoglycoside phosphotransferase family protein [Pedobacter nyackensis]|uniref:phosphotransferase enzyme family protein n=1 Tax=Pedobacter nyackensis TaxID=475255 RepID=UPI00292EDF39|nr:aminoglycoside phosphotransferase family protein [Pedobacter nyackensis]